MKQVNDIDIMAPAGNYESLAAAIQAGADSVYFGAGNLNMRAKSTGNFTIHDIKNVVKECSSEGVKTYLTVNSVIYDSDITAMNELISEAKNAGVNAIIASDMAAVLCSRKAGMEVHASTQLNISNYHALEYFSQYCDVIVLARELDLAQISEIYRKVVENGLRGPSGKLVKLELFVHGALCMSVSGKCYISLHENGNSANRGQCLQNCRRSYILTDKETGYQIETDTEYLMSPKDICTIDILDRIIGSGISVLKIEGRARSPEYVKIATKCYKEAAIACLSGTYSAGLADSLKQKLETVYNRGFWDGFYLGGKTGQLSRTYGSLATKRKEYSGKITNYFKKACVAEILVESAPLSVGSEILIIGSKSGVAEEIISEIRIDNEKVETAVRGDVISIPVANEVRKNDKIYIWVK